MKINETDKQQIVESLREHHKLLGEKIEKSTSDGNIRTHQAKRQNIRSMAVTVFNQDRAEVNQWE